MQASSTGGGEEVRALWSTETTLLDSLMYRNKNQHGRAGYWKRLQEVKRRTKELDVPALLELLATIRQDLLVGTQGMQSQKQQTKAKAQAQALAAKRCVAVGMAIQQCCAALESCTGAAELLVQEVAQGYFLNLLVLFLAMLGRVSALLRHVGTLAFGLHQALEGRVGEVEAGQEGVTEQRTRPRLPMRKFAHALGLDAPREEEGTTVEGVSVKRQAKAGQDNDDDDDLGVSLGAAAAAASFTFPIPAAPGLSVRTKVIPASTGASVANAAATSTSTGKAAVASRAMLASEYSSSSEEEEEGEDEDEAAPAKQQQQQQQSQPPPPALPTVEALKQKEEDEASAAAIRFVIDRKPATNPPGSSSSSSSGSGKPANVDQKRQPHPQTLVSRAPTVASGGAAKKNKIINKDKQKDKREASGGSLLDEIDDIFNAAGAKKAKKRKMNK